ncbi:hypothetical protein [Burkholderia sp. Tr-862]|uniref:hypothetical protein n=1 Tax=Burkholderia sp. Tr-862 TaxID=2608331 RepID=UPI0014196A57|nr:hypothetical protein [Burkholderia sp. Tr-862]
MKPSVIIKSSGSDENRRAPTTLAFSHRCAPRRLRRRHEPHLVRIDDARAAPLAVLQDQLAERRPVPRRRQHVNRIISYSSPNHDLINTFDMKNKSP